MCYINNIASKSRRERINEVLYINIDNRKRNKIALNSLDGRSIGPTQYKFLRQKYQTIQFFVTSAKI